MLNSNERGQVAQNVQKEQQTFVFRGTYEPQYIRHAAEDPWSESQVSFLVIIAFDPVMIRTPDPQTGQLLIGNVSFEPLGHVLQMAQIDWNMGV